MLLVIDIGNTHITLGLYDQERLMTTARLATDDRLTPDQYAVSIAQVMALHGADIAKISGSIVSSVVPAVGDAIRKAVALLCDNEPLMLGPGIKSGLNIRIDNPAQLGADLAAGAAGALGKYPLPCIIVDMGTATTVTVLDGHGNFLGGAIAAGVRLTLEALASGTAALPTVHPAAPKKVIGTNTVDCMQSGLVYGAAAMIDGLVDRMEDELGQAATVVATGGMSKEIIAHCKRDILYDEHLLLDGLRLIYERNR